MCRETYDGSFPGSEELAQIKDDREGVEHGAGEGFSRYIPGIELICSKYKELSHTNKKKGKPSREWVEDVTECSTKGIFKWPMHEKMLTLMRCQGNATENHRRCCNTSTRMAQTRTTGKTQHWWGFGAVKPLIHCHWGCKWHHQFGNWMSTHPFVSYSLAIPLSGRYPAEMHMNVHQRHMHRNVHSSHSHISNKVEPIQESIKKR